MNIPIAQELVAVDRVVDRSKRRDAFLIALLPLFQKSQSELRGDEFVFISAMKASEVLLEIEDYRRENDGKYPLPHHWTGVPDYEFCAQCQCRRDSKEVPRWCSGSLPATMPEPEEEPHAIPHETSPVYPNPHPNPDLNADEASPYEELLELSRRAERNRRRRERYREQRARERLRNATDLDSLLPNLTRASESDD